MLRITKVTENGTAVTLKLEGQIASAWVGEFELECGRWLEQQRCLHLDFRDVTFVDTRGRKALARLRGVDVEIFNCPALIRELLDEVPQG